MTSPESTAPSTASSRDPVTLSQVQDDLRVLLRDAQELLTDTTRAKFDEKAGEASDAIRQKMETLRALAERKRAQAESYELQFEDFVRSRPLTAVGGAFVLGMLTARIFGD